MIPEPGRTLFQLVSLIRTAAAPSWSELYDELGHVACAFAFDSGCEAEWLRNTLRDVFDAAELDGQAACGFAFDVGRDA